MPHTSAEETADGIRVSTPYWRVEHLRSAGGAWSSLVFTHGSGKNLLRRPLSGALRLFSGNSLNAFCESNEKAPKLWLERNAAGCPVVISEGTFRDAGGRTVPVGFRRRTEYLDHGLVWSTLDLMSDSGCDEVVEVRALELPLRAGLTDCFVRFHPTQAGGADLLGGRGWYDLKREGTPFLSRFTPLQVLCFEKGVEGLEVFPGSELAQWDCGLKPDAGLGLYRVAQEADGTTLELAPYCLAFRRIKLRVQGHSSFRLGFGLPFIKPAAPARSTLVQVSAGASEKELDAAAKAGAKALCYQDNYRDDAPFWRNGVYPPYAAAGMQNLGRLVEAAHARGLKIVPYVSLKELHPEAAEFKRGGRDWMHLAAPSLDPIHNWSGKGETGALMCLKSGWFDFRNGANDVLLKDLAWDGLFFDAASFHPCCHPGHGRGPHHSDIEQFLELLAAARRRVGEKGHLILNLSGAPSLVAENIADAVCLTGDHLSATPLPGHFSGQVDFMPIAPRAFDRTAGVSPA